MQEDRDNDWTTIWCPFYLGSVVFYSLIFFPLCFLSIFSSHWMSFLLMTFHLILFDLVELSISFYCALLLCTIHLYFYCVFPTTNNWVFPMSQHLVIGYWAFFSISHTPLYTWQKLDYWQKGVLPNAGGKNKFSNVWYNTLPVGMPFMDEVFTWYLATSLIFLL